MFEGKSKLQQDIPETRDHHCIKPSVIFYKMIFFLKNHLVGVSKIKSAETCYIFM